MLGNILLVAYIVSTRHIPVTSQPIPRSHSTTHAPPMTDCGTLLDRSGMKVISLQSTNSIAFRPLLLLLTVLGGGIVVAVDSGP